MRMLLSSLVLLALPAFATAQTDDKAARDAAQTHFQSGVKFSEAGDYEHALIEFDAGYKLSHEPDFLHNLSWTCERLGRIAEAIDWAEKYVAAVPNADNAERTRRRIERLRATLPKPAPAVVVAPAQPGAVDQAPSSFTGKGPAIALLSIGAASTLAGIGLLAGAGIKWSESQNASTYYDRWLDLQGQSKWLTVGGSIAAATGTAIIVGGIVLWRKKSALTL
jgi:tetratricopeptide (TPR) repeat protein